MSRGIRPAAAGVFDSIVIGVGSEAHPGRSLQLLTDHSVVMNPLKVAIVGGGPSSFYVASRLLSLVPPTSTQRLRVHVYDRLWSPYGLVRYGVAPDHPEVKVARR